MSSASSQGGFTIVETLIVLAVTAMMLTSAMILIVGQQNRVQFTQSMQDIQSVIQQTMNEVGAGYYPSANNIECSPGGGGVNLSTGSTEQGANTGCIFLGKAIQFASDGTAGTEYRIYSIAGRQDDGGITDSQRTLADATPTAIARGQTTNQAASVPDATDTKRLLYGLKVVGMWYTQGGSKKDVGAVAFLNGLGSFKDSQLVSGTQQLSLVPVDNSDGGGSVVSQVPERVVDAINTKMETSPQNPDGGVSVCFSDGSPDRSGLITIGSNGRSLSVKLDMKGTGDCS